MKKAVIFSARDILSLIQEWAAANCACKPETATWIGNNEIAIELINQSPIQMSPPNHEALEGK